MKTHEEKVAELRADAAAIEAQLQAVADAIEQTLTAIRFVRLGASGALHFFRWLCAELVNALLRPVWSRVACAKGARRRRWFCRFEALVDGADCWPCCIQYALGGGLFITSSGHDFDDDFN